MTNSVAIEKTDESRSPDRKLGIIVVGDWIIDQYWFLSRHQSETSASVGYNHFKISSNPGALIAALCGAAHTAKIIHTRNTDPARTDAKPPFVVFGLGLWNDAQTTSIIDLLQPSIDKRDHFANARFGGDFVRRPTPDNLSVQTLVPDADTIQTIRFYQYSKGELEQLSRVDWDRSGHSGLIEEAKKAIRSFEPPADITGIVVHDLGKGAIRRDLVQLLSSKFPEAAWYVRTKSGTQDWIIELAKNGKLYLNVAGPETTSAETAWNDWIVRRKPTLDGMRYLNTMQGRIIVAISRNHEVIMKSHLDPPRCFVGRSSEPEGQLTQLGWSSYFFSDFAFEMIRHDNRLPTDDKLAEEAIKKIIVRADAARRVVEPHPPPIADAEDAYAAAANWLHVQNEWEMAHADKGIIQDPIPAVIQGPMPATIQGPTPGIIQPPSPRLELWRSNSVLPNYVTCVEEKRNLIKRIGRGLTAFRRARRPPSSLNILLTADPGTGKSSLVKAFAAVTDFAVIQRNITQMLHRDELLHLFDEVAAYQANDTKPIMVFVDEINSVLESEYVFSAFLAPLEDGAYLRQGRKVSLRPCVWFFVGTSAKEGNANEYNRTDKYSDFLSRMTMVERMDYAYLKTIYGLRDESQLNREARLEQVYLGMTLLRHNHPDLVQVEQQVIDAFWDLSPDTNPARLIRRRAATVRGVQVGTIRRSNCSLWQIEDWTGDEQMVEITS
jgi:ATPase family associated with various cellular activities (AAA)